MEMLATLMDILKTVALPLGIAIITAQVTLNAGRQQIRAHAAERNESRQYEHQKRLEDNDASARAVRGETIEAISDAMDQYVEDVRSEKNPTTAAVTRSLFRLSSRCSADHLADTCRSYVEDSARAPDRGHVVEAMLDIRRRLLGWHIGHLTLEDTERLIQEGHRELVEHLDDVRAAEGAS
ncbi:hypothetical protein HWD94_12560 [Pseudarthrobacter equi]|uniref:hypothetical protein n=1 Tax=Pseudarthrobacter TaxID=1742993 RepID=UPI001585889D|nr:MULTISPECIES: hypothetical protein [Pseudarthrobacter]MCT9625949.1 hypothetical protein [Pseudarthrobacter equi]NUT72114.1 hypothetical protein [Pseudarthrobacter sp. C4D7]